MHFFRKTVSVLCAFALLACALPACAEANTEAQAPFVFRVESAALPGDEAEAVRREALASPLTEADILSADPSAALERRDGRIYMIRGRALPEPVTSVADACRAVYRLLPLLGGGGDIRLVPWSVLTAGRAKVYVFQHVFEGLTVVGSIVKLATDENGAVTAVFSSLAAENPAAAGSAAVSPREAEDIVRSRLSAEGKPEGILPEYTCPTVLPPDFDPDEEEVLPDRLAWVVFSAGGDASPRPYLAHYVDASGAYLYSCPVAVPGDRASLSASEADYFFDGMEASSFTGTVEDARGNPVEITVPVMRDPESGLWLLGDPQRKIIFAEFAPMVYGENRSLVPVTSETGDGWERDDLFAFRNLVLTWDYYAAMGWKGPEGTGAPILVLRNMCGENGETMENACYAGVIDGWQTFCYGGDANLTAALDVIAHEFTHGVTTAAMNTNLYEDDYGAINEALSDIMGNLCEQALGATTDTSWLVGENTGSAIRSLSDPHLFDQPEYVWDIFYTPDTDQPNDVNDRGGVHSNSSLLGLVASRLCMEDGMGLEAAAEFWLTAACALTPATDYLQLEAMLPWALETSGHGDLAEQLLQRIGETRMSEESIPDTLAAGQRLVSLKLPETETFDDPGWIMLAYQIDAKALKQWVSVGVDAVLSLLFDTEADAAALETLLGDAGLLELLADENADPEKINLALQQYFGGLVSQHTSWISAGNSREIKAVMKRFSTLYLLLNMDPDTLAFRGAALLAGDEWIDLSPLFSMDGEEMEASGLLSFLTPERLSLVLQVLLSLPDLFSEQDSAEASLELPTAGLEAISLLPAKALPCSSSVPPPAGRCCPPAYSCIRS